MSDPIYLDHNATTPVDPEVVETMLPYLQQHFGNPSSGHVYGRRAQRAVERAREQVAGLLGCAADEVTFTSGGTEANNIAIRGVAAASGRRHVITSVIEHPATVEPCALLERQGLRVSRVGVDEAGAALTDEAAALVDEDVALVTLMHANNETGTLQPVAEIAAAAHARGALVHSDAAQSVGKVPTRVDDLGVDLLSVAGHKLYAPKGVGALYVRRHTPVHPVLLGAGHERGLRPGTENVAYIAGLGRACEVAAKYLEAERSRILQLREAAWETLSQGVPGLQLNGHPDRRLPNTLNVRFPRVAGSAVLAGAPVVAASTGSACHEGGERPSSVLTAMGLGDEEALGAVRLSLGRGTTAGQILRAAVALVDSFKALTR